MVKTRFSDNLLSGNTQLLEKPESFQSVLTSLGFEFKGKQRLRLVDVRILAPILREVAPYPQRQCNRVRSCVSDEIPLSNKQNDKKFRSRVAP